MFNFLSVLPLDVTLVVPLSAEGDVAGFASDDDPGMSLPVLPQGVGGLVLLAALLADVGPGIGVDCRQVLLQSPGREECLFTLITLVRSDQGLGHVRLLNVLVQVASNDKTGSTSFTNEGLFSGVPSHVLVQH